MLIPNCDLNTNFVNINSQNPGFSFEGVFLSLSIKNIDKFVADYQENAYIFINKIYYLFHSIGSILMGDVVPGGNLIIWKKKEEYFKSLENYTNLITNMDEKMKNQSNSKESKNSALYSPSMLQYINLSVIAGIKFITSIYREIYEFTEITKKYNIKIFLLTDTGTFYHGYFSSMHNLNSLFLGNELFDARKLTVF